MTRPDSSPSSAVVRPAIEVRSLKTHAEYAACVELQRVTWGIDYGDCVPASVLKVSQYAGGVAVGAFDEDGRLIGFVFGFTGVREGRLIHWSHMLAVLPEFRNHGVGRRLKEAQRELLGVHGIETIYWTFDPLVARNAHLNINRLGAEVREYVPDMYGNTGSALHAAGTDRFVVAWSVVPDARPPRGRWDAQSIESARAVRLPELTAGDGTSAGAGGHDPLLVEIPADIEAMSTADARAWRAATRPAFLSLMNEGFRVSGFVVRPDGNCCYVLSRVRAPAVAPEATVSLNSGT